MWIWIHIPFGIRIHKVPEYKPNLDADRDSQHWLQVLIFKQKTVQTSKSKKAEERAQRPRQSLGRRRPLPRCTILGRWKAKTSMQALVSLGWRTPSWRRLGCQPGTTPQLPPTIPLSSRCRGHSLDVVFKYTKSDPAMNCM